MQEYTARITGQDRLCGLLGRNIVLLASHVRGGMSPGGAAFVATQTLAVPSADYSAGRAYTGDFVEISTDWHQSEFGDDYHSIRIESVDRPCDAGARIVAPLPDQYPFEAYPWFYGEYFDAPVTRIEVLERTTENTTLSGEVIERNVYDSHLRLHAGERIVTLTTEHGSILGQIEIYSNSRADAARVPGFSATRLRLAFEP